MRYTQNVYAHAIMGTPPAGSPQRCLSEISAFSQRAASHFPTAPPPDPGKDIVGGHFSHFEGHFPGRLGSDPSVIFSHGSLSCFQLP